MTTDEMTPPIPLTREALYALVWSEPMLKVAARYDVSSSYMARVCNLLNVPRPEPGYCAKLAAGKASPIPPLPDPRPGDELVWSRDGQACPNGQAATTSSTVQYPKAKTKVNLGSSGSAPVRQRPKELFEVGRLSYDSNYLKPMKKLLIDLVVTKKQVSIKHWDSPTISREAARPDEGFNRWARGPS